MREKCGKYLLILVSLLCLVGCGEPGSDSPEVSAWGAGDGESLYINEFIPLQFVTPDIEYQDKSFFYDTYGSRLYVLWAYTGEEGVTEYQSLYVFDGDTKEMEQQPFALRISGRESSHIQSMDVRDGGQISFRMRDGEGDFLVITDMEGNIVSRQDTFPNQGEYPWNEDLLHRFENRAYDIGDGTIILGHCKDQENVTELSLYDAESGQKTSLAVFDGELVRSLCMDGEDTMYYTTTESLNRWDKSSNTRTRLLELHANGLSSSPVSNNLLTNSQGELLVCELGGDIPCVMVLSGEESQKEDEIRITYFTGAGDHNLVRSAQIFSQTHPELKLVQERCQNEDERYTIRDRTFMELAAGRGPELMWVFQEDMEDLYEKGLLMDLSELIPEDIQEQLVPGAIQSGTIDGTWAGVKLYVLYETIFVSDALWEEDSWTVQDVIEIMESREDWDFTFSYFLEGMDSYELLSEVLLPDLDGSEFLDTEQGYCNFDSPEFIRLLEVCKKYGYKEYKGQDRGEQARQFKDGDGIGAVMPFVQGILSFSSWMNTYDGSAHMVGFPGREGSKNYIIADNTYLVVNANAEHLEEIKELIAYLLSYEIQFEDSYNSVRKDVIRDCVGYDEFRATEKYYLKVSVKEDGTRMVLDVKPDGTPWLEEYLAFIETCEPEPSWRYTPIGEILSEEVQPYFVGDKRAEDVAKVIRSRVQMYLEEHK